MADGVFRPPWRMPSGGQRWVPTRVPAPITVEPGVGDATWAGFAPTISIGTPVTVTPGLGEATWDGFAPTIGLPVTVFPGLGEGTWTGFAIALSLPLSVSPGLGEGLWNGFAPTQVGTPSAAAPVALRFRYDP